MLFVSSHIHGDVVCRLVVVASIVMTGINNHYLCLVIIASFYHCCYLLLVFADLSTVIVFDSISILSPTYGHYLLLAHAFGLSCIPYPTLGLE